MTRKPECCTGLSSLPAKSPEFTEPKPSSCDAVHIYEQARFGKIEGCTARPETNTGIVGRLESLLTFGLGYRSGEDSYEPIVLLDFQPACGQIHPQTFLGDYRDVVMSDE